MAGTLEIVDALPDEVLRGFLARDRVWNCLALADMEPRYRRHARFPAAVGTDGSVAAVVLIYDTGSVCSVIPFGDPAGIAAVLAGAQNLPRRPTISVLPEAMAAMEVSYRLGAERHTVRRLGVVRGDLLPVEAAGDVPVEVMGPSAVDEINGLLARWLGHEVTRAQLVDGGVRGIRDANGRLVSVAVAGPPSARAGIAVVGQVYTAREARGRGLAKAVTASLSAALLDAGYDLVVLNVLAANHAANRAYASVGFTERLAYVMTEGELDPLAGEVVE